MDSHRRLINTRSRASAAAISGALVVLCAAADATAQTIPDKPPRYVVDLANIIDDHTKQWLEAYLLDLATKTTVNFRILTIESTEGVPIREFALDIAHNRWKLGHKDKDNGVLLLVAVKDRKYSIEVGYGLEGTLPDGYCGRQARKLMVPAFKQGDYAGGIYRTTYALVNRIAKEAGVEIIGPPDGERPAAATGRPHAARRGSFASACCFQIFFLGMIMFVIASVNRQRSYYGRRGWGGGILGGLLLGSMLSGSRRHRGWTSSGGGFGGFGGFGGGGFGGGGSFGGGFGGGGASGGW